MKYQFPHVALQLMNELVSNKGDCSEAVLAIAKHLGFNVKEDSLSEANLPCGSRRALGRFADPNMFEAVTEEVARQELDGSITACKTERSSTCFQNCPLLMDLFLQLSHIAPEQAD